MHLLYCANGVVVATHDSGQNVPASAYGSDVSVIPWQTMQPLVRIGDPPPIGRPDARRYAAPVLSGVAQLSAYAETKQQLVLNGGITVDVGSKSATVMVEASTDPASLVFLHGAYAMAQASAAATFQWVQKTGAPITLTSAQLITIFNAVTNFIQASFTTLAEVKSAITGETITTQADIDTPPPPISAWPVNS